MKYKDSIRYLEDLYRRPFVHSSRAGLERAAFLLAQIGNPHRSFRSIHVAGSTGKGSTTTMIGGILQAAGYRTGMFRSPHLREYTERVAVDDTEISPSDWARHVETLRPIAEHMEANGYPDYTLGRPTLFELLFAISTLHFAEQQVEWAVLEAGLGGRLDATNLVESDVAVVTNISLEHTQILGTTIPVIAREKAAIIKNGSSAVTAAQGEALAVIAQRASDQRVTLLVVGEDIRLTRRPRTGDQRLQLEGLGVRVAVRLPNLAEYQAENAATAFGAALALRKRGVEISEAALREGLEHYSLPGRFEIVPGTPTVILDGAHNPQGVEALARSLQRRPDGILFAAMEDKDIERMARAIAGSADWIIVTAVPGSDRTASLARMQHAFASAGSDVIAGPDPEAALDEALVRARNSLLVTGSLYLVGLARERIAAVTA